MTWMTIIGDAIIFSCGVAVGHYGPKAVAVWFGKQIKSVKKRVK